MSTANLRTEIQWYQVENNFKDVVGGNSDNGQQQDKKFTVVVTLLQNKRKTTHHTLISESPLRETRLTTKHRFFAYRCRAGHSLHPRNWVQFVLKKDPYLYQCFTTASCSVGASQYYCWLRRDSVINQCTWIHKGGSWKGCCTKNSDTYTQMMFLLCTFCRFCILLLSLAIAVRCANKLTCGNSIECLSGGALLSAWTNVAIKF